MNSIPDALAERAALEYHPAEPPAPGSTVEVAPGVRWARMPLPFQLDHINLWLLEDAVDGEPGWTVVDTGIGNDATRALWERLITGALGGLPVRRVLVTHYHPDHAGNAEWLCRRFGVELWMSQAEYLTAHAVRAGLAGYTPDAVLAVFRRNGLDEARHAKMALRGNRYAGLVPEFPRAHRSLYEGDRLAIGARPWRVIVGRGHAPEHVSLYSDALNTLIAGDMLLSTISTNVSVWSVEPEGDPLRLFLESIGRYRTLPADALVLPSHGRPFRGAHLRVAQLEAHHDKRFAALRAACTDAPRSACELLETLFPRRLDVHETFFALGETIAHLHALYYRGELTRAAGSDGVMRYTAARGATGGRPR